MFLLSYIYFRQILREPLYNLKLSNEPVIVLHKCFAKRPTKTGLFYKKVCLVVIPGRLLEFEAGIPKLISAKDTKTSVNLSNSTGASIPMPLTHSNLCPREAITLFNTQPPNYSPNSTKIEVSTFTPENIIHEYLFSFIMLIFKLPFF